MDAESVNEPEMPRDIEEAIRYLEDGGFKQILSPHSLSSHQNEARSRPPLGNITNNQPQHAGQNIDQQEISAESAEQLETRVTFACHKQNAFKMSFKRNENRNRRQSGHDYLGHTKEGNVRVEIMKPGKAVGPPCKLQHPKFLQCKSMTSELRIQILHNFYTNFPTKHEQMAHVRALVHVKTLDGGGTSRAYFLLDPVTGNHIRVCSEMFASTLAQSPSTIQRWSISTGKPAAIRPETGLGRKHKHEGLDAWISKLPRVESHYRRASNSGRQYVSGDDVVDASDDSVELDRWISSKQQLFGLYVEDCAATHSPPLSRTTFYEKLEKAKISIFRPKNDLCNTCDKFKTMKKRGGECLNQEEMDLKEEFERHMIRKQASRDQLKAEVDTWNGKDLIIQMDLQACITIPKSNANIMYYRSKLNCHHHTFLNVLTKEVDSFLWDETEGGLDSNVFVTIVYKFLCKALQVHPEAERVVFFSDGCAHQNRNAILSSMLLALSDKFGKVIDHFYFEVGHTQMLVDSVHSLVERSLKRATKIVLPKHLLELIVMARPEQPFQIHLLDHSYFLNFKAKSLLKDIRPKGWKVFDLRGLQYVPGGEVRFKIDLKEDWAKLCLNKKRDASMYLDDIPRLYEKRQPIAESKFKHIQEIKRVTVPEEMWEFFDNIPFGK